MRIDVKTILLAAAGLLLLSNSALALEGNDRRILAEQLVKQCKANLGKTLEGAMGQQGEAARQQDIDALCDCLGDELAAQITDADVEALTEGRVPDGYKQKAARITMRCMSQQ